MFASCSCHCFIRFTSCSQLFHLFISVSYHVQSMLISGSFHVNFRFVSCSYHCHVRFISCLHHVHIIFKSGSHHVIFLCHVYSVFFRCEDLQRLRFDPLQCAGPDYSIPLASNLLALESISTLSYSTFDPLRLGSNIFFSKFHTLSHFVILFRFSSWQVNAPMRWPRGTGILGGHSLL